MYEKKLMEIEPDPNEILRVGFPGRPKMLQGKVEA